MSYLHCPTCQRAYNVAVQPACPYCPVQATPVDPTADIVIAAEQLARAIARAKPAERDAAAARMDRLALPAPGDAPVVTTALRSIRAVLAPPAPPPERPRIASIAFAVLARIEARPRLRRAAELVRARVRALAA
ncbi:MAG TPA: hypothetical protein VLX92_15050 [Kofleriaceae bacterium]|nr:hypothetical protein [Kofleriaceae bacterium]